MVFAMSVNRTNFGKAVLGSRAILGLNRMDLASRAHVGHETLARIERGETGVSMNTLAAVQRALEEADIEFPHGSGRVSLLVRERPLTECGVVADRSMPSGTRFQGG